MIPHRIPFTTEGSPMKAQILAALISYARLFAGACLGTYIYLGVTPFTTTADDLKAILSAGIAALALVVFNALNTKDERYGFGAPASADLSAGDVATNTENSAGYSIPELLISLLILLIIIWVLMALFG